MSEVCRHFQTYIKEQGLDAFRIIDAVFASCINKEAREKKALTCCCFECGSYGIQLYACLHCVYFGCRGTHIGAHLRSKKHPIALDLSHSTIYCYSCRDFIYDSRCREISAINRRLEAKDLQKSLSWQPWIPTPKETNLMLANPRRRYVRANETIGLRGLINLGSTCFMNCIVQTLIHTPLLSDYFLSERHECSSKTSLKCLVCEVSRLFQEFYSGSRTPLSLHRLLHLIWNHAKHLAGYEQQDAHEFFIATLDVLHRHCLKAKTESEQQQQKEQQQQQSQCANNKMHNSTNIIAASAISSSSSASSPPSSSLVNNIAAEGNGSGGGGINCNSNSSVNSFSTGNGNGSVSNCINSTSSNNGTNSIGNNSNIIPINSSSSSVASAAGGNGNGNGGNGNNNNIVVNGLSIASPEAPLLNNNNHNTKSSNSNCSSNNLNCNSNSSSNNTTPSSTATTTTNATTATSSSSAAAAAAATASSIMQPQCNCIIDQIFTGMLQSDVVCQACKNVSTTIDPFWDISLDLGETVSSNSSSTGNGNGNGGNGNGNSNGSNGGNSNSSTNSMSSTSSSGGNGGGGGGGGVNNGGGGNGSNSSMPKTLIDCLERYTRAEHLGSSAKIKCSTCKSYQESTKQFSLRTLPSVASFHLKRFEHSSLIDKKISTFISFPLEFDMTPFMSDKNNAYGDFRYSLYAVVNHVGTIDSGHYTAYVRHHKDTWVKCDDHIITSATLKQVLDSEGYLLFYHKNILEYE